MDKDEEGALYLVVHSGSRNLGKQIAEHYQNLACDLMIGKDQLFAREQALIKDYKAANRRQEIQEAIKALRQSFVGKEAGIPKHLCYLYGAYRQQYLEDMQIAQQYATLNREVIADIILKKLFDEGFTAFTSFETIHNYIDLKSNLVRKGAVSAQLGEILLIPINMRDGSLLCVGKGNEDWNCSAPHGAGRLYSRTAAKERFGIEEYAEAMQGIYTTSVGFETLDECPMAYKSIADIVEHITPTADIIKIIKPLYNFKAKD